MQDPRALCAKSEEVFWKGGFSIDKDSLSNLQDVGRIPVRVFLC